MKKFISIRMLLLIAPLLGSVVLPASGQIPDTVSFQAKMLDAAGNPVSGDRPMAVTVWTAEVGGDLVFTQNVGLVAVEDGLYDFDWGGPGLYDALSRPECWLQVHVDGEILSPRERLVSVPYAQRARSADLLTTQGITALVTNLLFTTLSAGPNFTDESDGDLISSNEVITFDVGGQSVFVKNFRDVAITDTASLVFTNGHTNGTTVILNCRTFTLTSFAVPALNVSGLGAWGGNSNAYNGTATSVSLNGGDGRIGYGMAPLGAFGGSGANSLGGSITSFVVRPLVSEYALIGGLTLPGGGGGGGRLVKATDAQLLEAGGGRGGNGGGAVIILCEENWTVTGSIWANGESGSNGVVFQAPGDGDHSVAGGGGGGGGSIMGLYGRLVANSGIHQVAGGLGGTGRNNDIGAQGGGGGGASIRANGFNGSGWTGGRGAEGSVVIGSARAIGR